MKTKTCIKILIICILGNLFFIKPSLAASTCHDESIVIFTDYLTTQYWCSKSKNILPLKNIFSAISPNSEWIVRYDYNTKPFTLQIIPIGDNKSVSMIQSEKHWLSSGLFWVDDQRITLNVLNDEGKYVGDRVIINPWTGKSESLSLNLPYNPDGFDELFSFSPNLNYVVYSAYDNRLQPDRQLVLYDILHSKIIWHVPQDSGLTPPFSYDPVWALDSSSFLYVGLPQNATTFAFELYSVNTQGIENQLTNFGLGGTSSSLIFAPHLSPNNKFIAFWKASPQIYMDPDANFKFTLLDLDSKQVKSFDLTHGNSGFFDMNWSPDSDEIALINGMEINDQVLSVLDIETGGEEQITHHAAAILTWCKCNITVDN